MNYDYKWQCCIIRRRLEDARESSRWNVGRFKASDSQLTSPSPNSKATPQQWQWERPFLSSYRGLVAAEGSGRGPGFSRSPLTRNRLPQWEVVRIGRYILYIGRIRTAGIVDFRGDKLPVALTLYSSFTWTTRGFRFPDTPPGLTEGILYYNL